MKFQSTLPAREATPNQPRLPTGIAISIHASREGSDHGGHFTIGGLMNISIHASREGSDATDFVKAVATDISIHASREGSDLPWAVPAGCGRHFNPRFPRGKRPTPPWRMPFVSQFQSTLPAREATMLLRADDDGFLFQSTLPAREATIHAGALSLPVPYFNPRFPRGKRPTAATEAITRAQISIHASREGSDSTVKLSPDDHTSRHGFREPGFLRFRHRQISCLFLLGAWGSRL